TSSGERSLASTSATSSSWVASRIASFVLDSTVVAPLMPRSRIASFVVMDDALPSRRCPSRARGHPLLADDRYRYGPNAPAAEYHEQPPETHECDPSTVLRAGLRTAGEHLNIVPNSLHPLFRR